MKINAWRLALLLLRKPFNEVAIIYPGSGDLTPISVLQDAMESKLTLIEVN